MGRVYDKGSIRIAQPRHPVRKVLLGAALVVALQASSALASTPRVKACLGTDTTSGARAGTNGTLRSWLAVDGSLIFGYGVSFGDIVQAHQAGYLGGTCGS